MSILSNANWLEVIMWGVVIASLVGTVANLYKLAWCFKVWFFCNVMWVFYDIHMQAYPQAVLMGIYACLAVWGACRWEKVDNDKSKALTKG